MFGSLFKKKKLAGNPDWLIVGLGNPGKKYACSRHNIGWMVAASLCTKYKSDIYPDSSIYYLSSITVGNYLAYVALPTTFMNNSGEAVSKLCREYSLPIEKLCIIVDEYNFPLGKIHLKDNGSDGGHNGMASIIEHLDTTNFMRLRCGIGRNFGPGGLVDYVLSDFTPGEIEERDRMINKAVQAIEHLIISGNTNRAMSEINSGKVWEKED